MNLKSSNERLVQRLISALALQKYRVFLKLNLLGEDMKMDEQLIKSKRRISSLWKRILHNKVSENVPNEGASKTKKPFFGRGHRRQPNDAECEKENSSSEKASEEDLSKAYSCVMSPEPQSLPTILKKSQTDPSYRNTPSSGRHATFKEVVKVHEYVVQDSLEFEEHYTSETSLTDDDEHPNSHKGFYVENYPEEDDQEEATKEGAHKNVDTTKLISDGERANIFRRLDGLDDPTEDSDESSVTKSPDKSKTKKRKSSKSKPNKKKTQEETPENMIFDFGVC